MSGSNKKKAKRSKRTIKLEDTIITEDYADQIEKRDYRFYDKKWVSIYDIFSLTQII